MVKEILCALFEHDYTQCTYSPQERFRQQKMHWQFRIELVKHMLSNAQQQPWGIVPVPDPVDCPLCLVDRHFIEHIPGQEGGSNVSKEALSDAGLGDCYKPKKYTSYWCSICKHALCIDPCFRLYHTVKGYTS